MTSCFMLKHNSEAIDYLTIAFKHEIDCRHLVLTSINKLYINVLFLKMLKYTSLITIFDSLIKQENYKIEFKSNSNIYHCCQNTTLAIAILPNLQYKEQQCFLFVQHKNLLQHQHFEQLLGKVQL